MNQLIFVLLLLRCIFYHVEAAAPTGQPSQELVNNFQPSVGVVIGILSLISVLTCIAYLYLRFCHRVGFIPGFVHDNQENPQGLIRPEQRLSGLDKFVIESLPFFKFSSLKGLRGGLECAVCLSKFEDVEILRLLPKCKHAFHITCVDQWLKNHSSCPLCRQKINLDDLTYSNSLRFLSSQSEVREDSNVELFVEREENPNGSSLFSIGSSFRKFDKGVIRQEELPIRKDYDGVEENDKFFHKFNHKIIMSDVVLKRRWSNLTSSDLVFLNSEMLGDASSYRFSSLNSNTQQNLTTRAIEDEQIMNFETVISKSNHNDSFPFSGGANTSNPSRFLNPNEKRSMSEVAAVSRFKEPNMRTTLRESCDPKNSAKEERLKRLWLPIARRTVQLYGNRDKESQQLNNTRQSLNV